MINTSMSGARLDRLPICAFHYRLLALIGAGMFLDGYDIYLQGPVVAELFRTKWSDAAGNATFISLSAVGLLIGTLISGWLGDRYGRRTMYQFNLLIFGLASLAAAVAPDFTTLLVCRLIIGIGLGGEIVTGYSTLAEFVPAQQRGRWQGILALLVNTGQPASALIALLVIPSFGWRWMFVFVGVLALVVWVMRKSMPESPRWCEIHGRQAESEALLAKIEAEVEKATGTRLAPVMVRSAGSDAPRIGVGALFRGALLRRTILGMILMSVTVVTVFAFGGWLPTILLSSGINMGNALLLTLLMQIGTLPGAALGAWAADRIGRRVSVIAAGLLGAVAAVIYAFMHEPVSMIVAGFLLVVLTQATVALVFGAYVPELFPTDVRMRGSSICNAASRVANIFAPFGVAFLLTGFGAPAVFFAIAAIMLVNVVTATVLGEETRGKSLEVIGEVAVAAT